MDIALLSKVWHWLTSLFKNQSKTQQKFGNLGNGFGHIAFGTSDLIQLCDRAKQFAGTVTLEFGRLKTSGGKDFVYIKDPDRHVIELSDWS